MSQDYILYFIPKTACYSTVAPMLILRLTEIHEILVFHEFQRFEILMFISCYLIGIPW